MDVSGSQLGRSRPSRQSFHPAPRRTRAAGSDGSPRPTCDISGRQNRPTIQAKNALNASGLNRKQMRPPRGTKISMASRVYATTFEALGMACLAMFVPRIGYLIGRGGRGELTGLGALIGRGAIMGPGGLIGRGPLKGDRGGTLPHLPAPRQYTRRRSLRLRPTPSRVCRLASRNRARPDRQQSYGATVAGD